MRPTIAGGGSWRFLNPWDDPLGDGFQMIQSIIAVGTGGVFGRGLMGGVQKLFYLPEPHNDFIYAVIARGARFDRRDGRARVLLRDHLARSAHGDARARSVRRIPRARPDDDGGVQAFFNISVVLGLLPTKGIPLPFVSYGGSSLLINLLGMGILLNVSQHAIDRTSSRRR